MSGQVVAGQPGRGVEVRLAAADAMAHSADLLVAAQRVCQSALAQCLASRSHLVYARLDGAVDGAPVQAVVRVDGSVAADRALIVRAELLVALGEAFDDGRIPAGLSQGPLAAALTLTRACDRVHHLEMGRAACRYLAARGQTEARPDAR